MKPILKVLLIGLSFVLLNGFSPSGSQVYICKSPKAYAYHYDKGCRGLKRCTYEVVEVSRYKAVHTYNRKLCGYED